MSDEFDPKKPQKMTVTLHPQEPDDMQKRDDVQFQTEVEQLIKDSENMRLRYMQMHKKRGFITIIVGLIFLLIGALVFGWLFLMEGSLLLATVCMVVAFIPFAGLHLWAAQPPKDYKWAYKREFLPRMANTLGGLKYYETRGIPVKIISRTGVLPAYDRYHAEDCFMGKYKGVKVILSEARLYSKKAKMPVFDGVFVLLEIPSEVFEGHTIITADIDNAQRWESSRWRKLSRVQPNIADPQANRFRVYSDQPDVAGLLVGERILKELAEAADIFKKSLLSAVMFHKKYMFLAIPYDGDMFEPSDISVPVATKQHALDSKREISQILEIIDVFELYNTSAESTKF